MAHSVELKDVWHTGPACSSRSSNIQSAHCRSGHGRSAPCNQLQQHTIFTNLHNFFLA